MFDDRAERFLEAIERNDPATIDSLLRRREVTVDQLFKVYYIIRLVIFMLNFISNFRNLTQSLKQRGICMFCNLILQVLQ